MSETDKGHLREEACSNLYFLGKGVLGYDQITWETHSSFCAFVQFAPAVRRLSLMPRGHLKSTIATITDSIRLALADPNGSRILIVNEIITNSRNFLDEIKNHWLHNQLLRGLFPELVPPKLVGPGSDWSQDRASLNRTSVFKEATWTAMGIGGSAQSQHFNRIKCDDLIGLEAKRSPAKMKAAIEWNQGIEALLDSPDQDVIDWIGTRKLLFDLYAEVMNAFGEDLAIFVREPIENGAPIFPLKYSLRFYRRLIENRPVEWAHDWMNNPVGEGAAEWSADMLQPFTLGEDSRGRYVYFSHRLTRELRKWYIDELDIVITVDPNGGEPLAPDKAAIVVHGTSPGDEIFILEAYDGRPSPSGLVDLVFSMCQRWHPRLVGIEKAGQQNTLFYFEKKCLDEGDFYVVQPLNHRNQDKTVRIRNGLDTPLRDRRFYALADELTLRNQVMFFPQLQAHNWDKLDCLSYGPEIYLKTAPASKLSQRERRTNVAKILAFRGATGYGRSYA